MTPTLPPILSADETLDTFFQGRIKIIQKKKGYRFSLDAVLVARLASVASGDRIIDLGTGSGIIPLLLAAVHEGVHITGIEIQPALADLALRNVEINGLNEVITIQTKDIRDLPIHYPPGVFDCVLANPPFRKRASGRVNPQDQKALARHEIVLSLPELMAVSARLLKTHGKIFLIYPAGRLVDLFFEMRNAGLEPKTLQLVCSRPGLPAKMVLVEGIRDGGVELKIKEPLLIYESDGQYTPVLQEIFSLPR